MKKKLTRILALILAGALVLTTLVSIVVSAAYGEEAEPARDSYAMEMKRRNRKGRDGVETEA